MERLTRYFYENCAGVNCEKCGRKKNGKCNTSADCAQTIADRLAKIEDILGDDYDLDRLRELVEADRKQEFQRQFQRHLKRFDIMPPKKISKNDSRMELTDFNTCDLVEELKKREGVDVYVVENGRWMNVAASGPALVLVVTD